ncbi:MULTISPECIES: hypothetical protein [unclassified Knoellia]|uniref:hypothetical protein n=1 Tax=Knoellia altitudinis TaxID=3404795 RepID=UPI00361157C2
MNDLTAGTVRRMVQRGDASDDLVHAALAEGLAAVDTETTGLDPSTARLCTIQIHVPGWGTEVVQLRDGSPPSRVIELVTAQQVVKIFHHAVFDLSFLHAEYGVAAASVKCTKVAAKILWPHQKERQSLAALSRDVLGVPMEKEQRMSDWTRSHLSPAQVAYAARDAEVLPLLLPHLTQMLSAADLLNLATRCWTHIPLRVELEQRGLGDVFSY